MHKTCCFLTIDVGGTNQDVPFHHSLVQQKQRRNIHILNTIDPLKDIQQQGHAEIKSLLANTEDFHPF